MIWPTVMVTGHRPQHLDPACHAWVRAELARLAVKVRDEHATTTGISGMALGADLWWADAVVKAGLKLWAHVPFPQQPAKWRPGDRAEWERLCRVAHRLKTYGGYYDVRTLHARNEGMVDATAADQGMVIAVWVYGKHGGTCEAIRYALSKGMRPTWVDPVRQRTWWPTTAEWQDALPEPRRRAA